MSGDNSESGLDQAAEAAREAAERVVGAAVEPIEAVASKAASGLKRFADLEASGGIVLVVAAVLALFVSNSALASSYQEIFAYKFAFKFGPYSFGKTLLHWINDGLMALFFFLVGLEIKREFLEGELNTLSKLILPLFAAVGGMVVPAAVFVAINAGDVRSLEGWAIPMATDIAFAMGALALLGRRIPASLSIFLLSLAIFDDLGAIIVIAMFYAGKISLTAIVSAVLLLGLLVIVNLAGVRRVSVYIILGIMLWFAVLESGVHATIAGVLLAFTVPIKELDGYSPLKTLEDNLHPWSAFVILPVFAFANAGVSFKGISADVLTQGMTLGIVAGLIVGKPLGVLIACRLAMVFKGVTLPENVTWPMLFGAAFLAGIGFTMSLFIGTLAYDTSEFDAPIRLGVIAGSIAAGVIGLVVLRLAAKGFTSNES